MPASLERVCREFEAVVLRSLWPHGLANAATDEPSSSRGPLEFVFAETFARAIAEAGGLGLGSELARALAIHPS